MAGINKFKELWTRKTLLEDVMREKAYIPEKVDWECPKCGYATMASNAESDIACPKCGTDLVMSKAIDIAAAGPVPNSLLAEQDLEGDIMCSYCGGSGMSIEIGACPQCHGSGVMGKSQMKKDAYLGARVEAQIMDRYHHGDSASSIAAELRIDLDDVNEIINQRKGESRNADRFSRSQKSFKEGWTGLRKTMVECPYCDGTGVQDTGDSDPPDCNYCMGRGKVDSKDLKDYEKSQIKKGAIRARDIQVGDVTMFGRVVSVTRRDKQYRIVMDIVFHNVDADKKVSYKTFTYDADDTIVTKGVIEQTGKALDIAAEKAEDADTTEKEGLIRNIKNIQLKRQRAIINIREKSMGKTFKDGWHGLKKDLSQDHERFRADIKMWEKKAAEVEAMMNKEKDPGMKREWKEHLADYRERIHDLKEELKRE